MNLSRLLPAAALAAGALVSALGASARADETPPPTCKDGDKPAQCGEKGEKAKECGEAAKSGAAAVKVSCTDGDAGCEASATCGKCEEGAKVEGSCCAAKMALKRARSVAAALLEDGTEAAKAVAAGIPAELAKKVEEVRTAAAETVAKARKALAALEQEAAAAAADAKEAGEELGDCVSNAYAADKAKIVAAAHAAVDGLGARMGEILGQERLTALAESVAKVQAALKAAAAKAAAAEKATTATDDATYRCGCSGKTWTQPATATKACPFCGSGMPDCGTPVEQETAKK